MPKPTSAGETDQEQVNEADHGPISAGMFGLLERTPLERRITASILREGPATQVELCQRLADEPIEALLAALKMLTDDGALTEIDGLLTVKQMRSTKPGARDLLDRLGDL